MSKAVPAKQGSGIADLRLHACADPTPAVGPGTTRQPTDIFFGRGNHVASLLRKKSAVPEKIQVLLIEGDGEDCRDVRGMLSGAVLGEFEITCADTYARGMEELNGGNYDVCLLGFDVIPRPGLELLKNAVTRTNSPPVIVLTGQSDYEVDLEAMRQGAADFLVKGDLNRSVLERSIRYAIERQRTRDRLSESEKQLRLLSSKLLEIQENERRKVALELHDNFGQLLSAFKFRVERVLSWMDHGDRCRDELQNLVPMVQNAIDVVRTIYTQLAPIVLEDLGITAALSCFCREFEEANPGIRVERHIGMLEEEIPEGLKLIIFRIVQEAMDNIAAHSHADSASVALFPDGDALSLVIGDNGRGFEVVKAMSVTPFKSGIGLISIKRRAELSGGLLEVDSNAGGTFLRVSWPQF
ncbi:MAG: histidine kinase [Desulfobacteraceae bacterium]|nr:histidine kinase [Desulfobacteraceae bacterium]